jgi:hypothetical protein
MSIRSISKLKSTNKVESKDKQLNKPNLKSGKQDGSCVTSLLTADCGG